MTWRYYDDNNVTCVTDPEAFLIERNKNTYVLMYELAEQTVESCLKKAKDTMELTQSISMMTIRNTDVSMADEMEDVEEADVNITIDEALSIIATDESKSSKIKSTEDSSEGRRKKMKSK